MRSIASIFLERCQTYTVHKSCSKYLGILTDNLPSISRGIHLQPIGTAICIPKWISKSRDPSLFPSHLPCREVSLQEQSASCRTCKWSLWCFLLLPWLPMRLPSNQYSWRRRPERRDGWQTKPRNPKISPSHLRHESSIVSHAAQKTTANQIQTRVSETKR